MNDFTIDPEFQSLCRPLTESEFGQLEDNIKQEGCRDPLVVWQEESILVDGHNRNRICTAHAVPYSIKYLSFGSRDEAMLWISRNQTGRRNLTAKEMSYHRGKQQTLKNTGQGGDRKSKSKNCTLIGDTAQRIADEHNVSRQTIFNDVKYMEAVDAFPIEERQEVLTGDYTKKAIVGAKGNKALLDRAQQKADKAIEEEINFGLFALIPKPHVSNNSGNNEWYTPPEFIEAARTVLGTIDLDPASSAEANTKVKAETYYTAADNGLALPWFGNVWMNPPYATPLVGQFADKLQSEWEAGNLSAFVVLVNNATETAWFRTMVACSIAVVFPSSRVKFWGPSGTVGAPLQGQAILYGGDNPAEFLSVFSRFGWGCDVNIV